MTDQRVKGDCSMCLERDIEVKHLPLYIVGSEGTRLCNRCEMDVVNYIRASRLLAGHAQQRGYQMAKQRGNVGEEA